MHLRSTDIDKTALRALAFTLVALAALACHPQSLDAQGCIPEESAPHEGTWLQWPHVHTYGKAYRNRLEPTWIAMTPGTGRERERPHHRL